MQNQPAAQVNAGVLTPLAKEIVQSLNADKLDLAVLSQLLTDERSALEQRDNKKITAFAERKSGIVNKMEQRNNGRVALLSPHQLSTEPELWPATLTTLEEASQLSIHPLWNEVKIELTQCREKLLINEKIIGGMQHSISRFLNILRGQTGIAQTYNASGKAQNYGATQKITSI